MVETFATARQLIYIYIYTQCTLLCNLGIGYGAVITMALFRLFLKTKRNKKNHRRRLCVVWLRRYYRCCCFPSLHKYDRVLISFISFKFISFNVLFARAVWVLCIFILLYTFSLKTYLLYSRINTYTAIIICMVGLCRPFSFLFCFLWFTFLLLSFFVAISRVAFFLLLNSSTCLFLLLFHDQRLVTAM